MGSAWMGILLGAAVLGGAVWLAGVPPMVLLHPEAWLLVLGGTIAALLVQFSPSHVIHALTRGWQGLNPEAPIEDSIEELVAIARYIRSQGVLALEPVIPELEDTLLAKGLRMIVDRTEVDDVEAALSHHLQTEYRQRVQTARLFEVAGGFAPTMGLLGAVLGLIHTLQGASSPDMLGPGLASAFGATLLGVALANGILLPLAGRLKERCTGWWQQRCLVLEGILSLHAGEHPIVLSEKLHRLAGTGQSSNEEIPEITEEAIARAFSHGVIELEDAGANHGALIR